MTKAPLRVVVNAISDNALPRGPERYTMELLARMVRLPNACEVVLLHAPWQGYYDRFDPEPRITRAVVDAPRRPLPRAMWQAARFAAVAGRYRADVVFLPNLLWTPGLSTPSVMTIHDLLHFRTPEKFGRLKAFLLRWLIRRAVSSADRLVAVSGFTAQDAVSRAGADPARLHVIHEGGPDPVPSRGRAEKAFLFVGKIERTKRVDLLIRAFTSSDALREAGYRLWIAGPDGNAARQVAPLLAHPAVERLGFVDNDALWRLYSRCRAFVFPSEAEGFGLVALEAMAHGAPVVVADATSLPEVVGDAGIVVPPGREAPLRAAMERLAACDRLCDDLRAAGHARLRCFSWDRAARQTLDVLQAAAAQREPDR